MLFFDIIFGVFVVLGIYLVFVPFRLKGADGNGLPLTHPVMNVPLVRKIVAGAFVLSGVVGIVLRAPGLIIIPIGVTLLYAASLFPNNATKRRQAEQEKGIEYGLMMLQRDDTRDDTRADPGAPLVDATVTHRGNDPLDTTNAIETRAGAFLGETGLLGVFSEDGVQRLKAVEAWLFDADAFTRMYVGLFVDTAADVHTPLVQNMDSRKDWSKNPVVVIAPGVTITLSSGNVRVQVTVHAVTRDPNGDIAEVNFGVQAWQK